jgi:hypothetical protein
LQDRAASVQVGRRIDDWSWGHRSSGFAVTLLVSIALAIALLACVAATAFAAIFLAGTVAATLAVTFLAGIALATFAAVAALVASEDAI